MAKGNYTALQQLKPTELKVGEYYNSFVDDLIKRGDADRAARAKKLADQKKTIGERFGQLKTDPIATIGQLTDLSNELFVDSASYIGQQGILAEQDPANAYKYLQRAERAFNDYRTLASAFGNKNFIDQSAAKFEALANNDVYAETDNNAKLAFLTQTKPIVKRNEETGNIELYMPKNENATPEDPLEKNTIGQTVSFFSSRDEINLLYSNKSNNNNGFLDKQIPDVAKQMSDEYSRNFDGNRTNAKKWFSQDRGELWFDSNFGVFNANRINPLVRQYSKTVNGKEIETEEDFIAAKKGIIDSVASLVGKEEKVDTKDSPLDIAIKQQRLINDKLQAEATRVAIRNAKSEGANNNVSESSASEGEFVSQVKDAKGNIVGFKKEKTTVMPISKNMFVGLSNSKDPKTGEFYNSYKIGKPNQNGEIVFSAPIQKAQLEEFMRANKINPVIGLSALKKKTTLVNKYQPNIYQSDKLKTSPYTKMEIFNPTEYQTDDQTGLTSGLGVPN